MTPKKKPDCEVKVHPDLSKDGFLELPWSLTKWQISTLLKGHTLPFCSGTDFGLDDDALYLVDPELSQRTEHFPPLTEEEVLDSCVNGEYVHEKIEGIETHLLLIGDVAIYFIDQPVPATPPSEAEASLCGRMVLAIEPMW